MANVNNYFAQPGTEGDNVFVITGSFHINDELFIAEHVKNSLASHDVNLYTTSTTDVVKNSGITLFEGGSGFKGFGIDDPRIGAYVQMKLIAISGGTVRVDTNRPYVTYDGANNIATFDTVGDELVLGYKSDTEWYVITNNGVDLGQIV